MEKYTQHDFIVIDDDILNNVICRTIIESELPGSNIVIYTNPQQALAYFDATYAHPHATQKVLLLDIDMPAINGWDILDKIKKLPDQVRRHLKIFILSSSVLPEDKLRAAGYAFVSGYIEKPFSQTKLHYVMLNSNGKTK